MQFATQERFLLEAFFTQCRFNTGDFIRSQNLLFAHKNYLHIFSKIAMVCAYNIHKSSELNKRQDNANNHSLFSLNNHDEAVTCMPIFLVLFLASGKTKQKWKYHLYTNDTQKLGLNFDNFFFTKIHFNLRHLFLILDNE